MQRVLFVGDSHLDAVRGDRLAAFEAAADCAVTNLAVGGSGVYDVPTQLTGTPRGTDVTVLSLGTNDCAPWKQIAFDDFQDELTKLVATLPGRLVYLAPPGVDDAKLGADDPSSERVDRYTDAARAIVEKHGGTTLETQQVLAKLGDDAFVEDGVHLTDAAYELLLAALARTVTPAGS